MHNSPATPAADEIWVQKKRVVSDALIEKKKCNWGRLGVYEKDVETENKIVICLPNKTIWMDIRLENETVRLTQSQMESC